MKALSAERDSRIPPSVQLANINAAVEEDRAAATAARDEIMRLAREYADLEGTIRALRTSVLLSTIAARDSARAALLAAVSRALGIEG